MLPETNSHLPLVEIPYSPPSRYGKSPKSGTLNWNLRTDHPQMEEHGAFVSLLDPMLDMENAAHAIYEKFSTFLCRTCGDSLVFNGSNGAGTISLLCKSCCQKMSLWNTYDLTLFRYKKMIAAFISYIHSSSLEANGRLFGIGGGLLNEVKWCLPTIQYSQIGENHCIEYDGMKYGVVTIDTMYKGNQGLILGVCGGLKIGCIGNESTAEGFEQFFSMIQNEISGDKYIFIMDMRMNIARKILERWGNKAIIVLQSHSIWGDVFVYFEYKGEWYTLHLRTDAFTEVSVKRNEHDLLTPGEIELFQGLKGVSHRFSLKSFSEEVLHQKVKAILQQVENTDWRMKGRVDLVMFSKLKKLNSLLKEMQRRNIDILDYLNFITTYIDNLITVYQRQPGRVTKRKIVRSFQGITLVEAQVNVLAHALLGHISEQETRRIKKPKPEKKSQRQTLTNSPTKLLFRGPITLASTIEPACWIINLLKKIFSGKEITTNACEGTFGSIGMEIRRGRSTYLERALTKVMLQRKSIPETVEWFSKNYPISDMGKRGTRGSRKRILLNRRYKIEYTDRWNVKTQRTVDIIRRKGKWIEVFCHLRRDFRTLKRRKINILDSQ